MTSRASLSLIVLAFAVGSVAGCGDAGLGELPERVNCWTSPGATCTTEGQWCASSNQCGTDVRYCKCIDGAYACTDPYTPAEVQTCTVVAEASCFVEGTGVCDQDPAGGGSCSCDSGTWSCSNSCDDCPRSAPADGAVCTTAATCRYAGPPAVTCTCAAGAFDCVPS